MSQTSKLAIVAVVMFGAVVVRADPDPQLVVVCSPGSPGTSEDAQPTMDAFAGAMSTKTGKPIAAVYDPTEAGGRQRLERAGMGIVSIPFFLKYEKDLGLHARLEAVQEGRPAHERWALVAQKGRIKNASSLAGFTIASNAAFAPGFVRGSALGELGALPANVKLVQAGAILSSLRHAADGDPIAVLLDGPQQASLASLPFASKLEVVAKSPPMPAGLVVTVDSRMPAAAWTPIEAALLGLGADRAGINVLAAFRMSRFAPLDDQPLAAARKAYLGAR